MQLLLFLGGVLVCSPILFLLTGSVMGNRELHDRLGGILAGEGEYARWALLASSPTLRHYVQLLLDSPEYFVMFWNSVKISVGILLGQLLTGTACAWAFAKYRFPFHSTLFMVYILLMMMPFQVTMLSSYLVLDFLQLNDTQLAVILPGAFSTFPVFIMYRFFCSVPDAIIDAARMDGAGTFQVFWYIGLPLGSPGILSAVVLGFLECWNLIEQPMTFLKTKSLWPLSLYLPNIDLKRTGISFAASVFTLIPALLVFLYGKEYLEGGIVAAAIKE